MKNLSAAGPPHYVPWHMHEVFCCVSQVQGGVLEGGKVAFSESTPPTGGVGPVGTKIFAGHL